MDKVHEKYQYIWDSIKSYFRIEGLDYSKLNRQLELFSSWVSNQGNGVIEACTGLNLEFSTDSTNLASIIP